MAQGAIVARILSQYSAKGSKEAQKDINKLGKRIDAFGKKAAKSFGLAAAASAALAIKIGKDSVQAAIEENRTQAILANTLRNVASATDATIKRVDQYIDKQEMLSTVSDTDLRASFGRLVSISGDVTEAMRLQTVALDVAAGTTTDFNVVSKAFEKAAAGKFEALKKVLPGIDASIIANKDLAAAEAYATKMYGGSAKAFGDTEPLKRLNIAVGRVKESIGAALLPVVSSLVTKLTEPGGVLESVAKWAEINKQALTDSFMAAVDKIGKLLKLTMDLGIFIEKYKVLIGLISAPIVSVAIYVNLAAAFTGMAFAMGLFLKALKGLDPATVSKLNKTGKAIAMIADGFKYLIKYGKYVVGIITGITTAFVRQGVAAGFAAIATAFATGGASILAASTILAAAGATAIVTKKAWDMYGDAQKEAGEKAFYAAQGQYDLTKQVYGGAAAVKFEAEQEAAAARARIAQAKIDAAIAAKAAAAQKKQDAIDKKTAALKKQIEDKYNVKITDQDEYENIQLTAVQKLMAKQKNADATLAERIKLRKEELALTDAINKSTQKYSDLLVALSDQKLSTEEITILSKKWGMSIDAVKSYIFTVFAISGEKISDSAVTTLMSAWSMTEAQAKQYLEFLKQVEKGAISDANIKVLAKAWYGSDDASAVTQARKYEDFVRKLGDGTLSQKDLEELKNRWNFVTNTEVVNYIKKIGIKVDAAGTVLSAGDIAAIGFTNALTALNAFLKALAEGNFTMPGITPVFPTLPPAATGCPAGSTLINGKCTPIVPPVVVPPKGDDKIVVTPDYSGDDGIARRAAAAARAAADAAAARASSSQGDALARFKAKEADDLAKDIAAKQAAAAIQANALAGFKAKEALDLASAKATAATNAALDADERSKFRAMQDAFKSSAYETPTGKFSSPTMDNVKGLMGGNSGGDTNVYLTVNGSVSTQQDLVTAIRTGLLATQTNGNGLTLQAV